MLVKSLSSVNALEPSNVDSGPFTICFGVFTGRINLISGRLFIKLNYNLRNVNNGNVRLSFVRRWENLFN